MIVKYHYAVLSFVTDLSDPRSEAVPVAVIAIGPITEEIGFCYFAAEKRPSIAADSDSFGLLKDLPKLLDTMIREGLAQAGRGKLLEWLQSSLRHTLALGQSRTETLSIETEPFQVQELLAGLAPLYERHVARPSHEPTPVRRLPTVHIDVTEASEFGQQTR